MRPATADNEIAPEGQFARSRLLRPLVYYRRR